MVNEQTFKTAFSGFNKQEVIEYINTLNREKDNYTNKLNVRISELENIAAEQKAAIKTKNKEIEKLLDQVDEAQGRVGGKLGEMSRLVDEMTAGERSLKENFNKKEASYKFEIKKLEMEIKKLKSSLQEKEETFTKETADIKISSQIAINDAKEKCIMEIDDLKREHEEKIKNEICRFEEQRQAHNKEISALKDAHKQEIIQVESSNKKAIEIARAEVSEIKASLDSARAIEEEARIRASKMIADTRMQCDDMRKRMEKEVADLREESMSIVDKEITLRKNEVREAYKKLQEIMDAVDNSKEKFAGECDRIKQSLQGLL